MVAILAVQRVAKLEHVPRWLVLPKVNLNVPSTRKKKLQQSNQLDHQPHQRDAQHGLMDAIIVQLKTVKLLFAQ